MNRNIPVPFLGEGQRQRRPLTRLRAVVPEPLKTAGIHVGRVLVRVTGSFDLTTKHGRVAGVSSQYCQPIHRSDGYSYTRAEVYAGRQADPTTQPAVSLGPVSSPASMTGASTGRVL